MVVILVLLMLNWSGVSILDAIEKVSFVFVSNRCSSSSSSTIRWLEDHIMLKVKGEFSID